MKKLQLYLIRFSLPDGRVVRLRRAASRYRRAAQRCLMAPSNEARFGDCRAAMTRHHALDWPRPALNNSAVRAR